MRPDGLDIREEHGEGERPSAARLVRAARGLTSNLRVQQMVVDNAATYGDYLVCRTWDGATSGDKRILVARPYRLRRTPFHNQSRGGIGYQYTTSNKRTATRESDQKSEVQIVVPAYRGFASDGPDTIYAVSGLRGGTGVNAGADPPPDTLAAFAELTWLDINVDGRAWAKESSTAAAVTGGVAGGADDDASQLSYLPGTMGDWTSEVDPGNIDGALDQLAARIRALELAGGGAPVDADYVVKSANAGLSAERVLSDVSRSGVKADWGTAGQLKLSATSTVFVVDATGPGTITNKTYASGTNPANKVLTGFESDNDSVTVYVEVDGGPLGGVGSGWQPVVTIRGGAAPVAVTNLTAVTNTRRFTGSATISAATSGTIYATVDDGGQSQNVTYTRALNPPLVLTAIFAAQASGIYPGVQTQFRNGQTARCTGTTEAHATHVYVKDFEATTGRGLQGPFTVTAGAFDFNTVVTGSANAAGQHLKLYAVAGLGTTPGADFQTTNTCVCDQTSPILAAGSIVYPTGQEALKDSETADATITHTNAAAGDTYLYDTNGTGEVSIPAATTYAATKTVTRIAGNYRETGFNYRLTATRTTLNGASAALNVAVKIAHTAPVVTVGSTSGGAVLPRMGSDNGTNNYKDQTVYLISSQANLSTHTPALSVSAGHTGTPPQWQGSWAAGTSLYYTRALRIKSADIVSGGQAANNWSWASCSVKNRAGKEAVTISTNPNYSLGGFQTRTLTQPAAPAHQIAIGCLVVDTAKLIAVNLSKGGSPTQTFEANITEHNNSNPDLNNYFTISNGSDVYDADGADYHNSDKLFSDSNTSGTAQISLQETP